MSKLMRNFKRAQQTPLWKPVHDYHLPAVFTQEVERYGLQRYLASVDACYKQRYSENMHHSRLRMQHLVAFVLEGADYYAVDFASTKALMLAAMFADVSHSFGVRSDVWNVRQAKEVLHNVHNSIAEANQVPLAVLTTALECIRHTQVPYSPVNTNVALYNIIRDADMMMPYVGSVDLLSLYQGMFNEKAYTARYGEEYTKAVFIQSQFAEMRAVVWNSSWGNVKAFENNWPQIVAKVIDLLEAGL